MQQTHIAVLNILTFVPCRILYCLLAFVTWPHGQAGKTATPCSAVSRATSLPCFCSAEPPRRRIFLLLASENVRVYEQVIGPLLGCCWCR